MKLQRMASQDADRALLGPIQPDLTAERVSKKKGFPDERAKCGGNHAIHIEDTKTYYAKDGSPLPKQEHYYRKANDQFLHGDAP